MGFALCNPNGLEWAQATSAGLRSLEALFSDRSVPVEHRVAGSHVVRKSDYPSGILLIPTGNDPTAVPAVLAVTVSSASEVTITLDPSNTMDLPCGGGAVFV